VPSDPSSSLSCTSDLLGMGRFMTEPDPDGTLRVSVIPGGHINNAGAIACRIVR
jgi:hypothetical protein